LIALHVALWAILDHVVAPVERGKAGSLVDRILNDRAVVVLDDQPVVDPKIEWDERIVLRVLAQPLPPVPAAAT
jgi:hypothetical protein